MKKDKSFYDKVKEYEELKSHMENVSFTMRYTDFDELIIIDSFFIKEFMKGWISMLKIRIKYKDYNVRYFSILTPFYAAIVCIGLYIISLPFLFYLWEYYVDTPEFYKPSTRIVSLIIIFCVFRQLSYLILYKFDDLVEENYKYLDQKLKEFDSRNHRKKS